jgi:hypothetical protein
MQASATLTASASTPATILLTCSGEGCDTTARVRAARGDHTSVPLLVVSSSYACSRPWKPTPKRSTAGRPTAASSSSSRALQRHARPCLSSSIVMLLTCITLQSSLSVLSTCTCTSCTCSERDTFRRGCKATLALELMHTAFIIVWLRLLSVSLFPFIGSTRQVPRPASDSISFSCVYTSAKTCVAGLEFQQSDTITLHFESYVIQAVA